MKLSHEKEIKRHIRGYGSLKQHEEFILLLCKLSYIMGEQEGSLSCKDKEISGDGIEVDLTRWWER